jgi:hypothetical protein
LLAKASQSRSRLAAEALASAKLQREVNAYIDGLQVEVEKKNTSHVKHRTYKPPKGSLYCDEMKIIYY